MRPAARTLLATFAALATVFAAGSKPTAGRGGRARTRAASPHDQHVFVTGLHNAIWLSGLALLAAALATLLWARTRERDRAQPRSADVDRVSSTRPGPRV